MNRFVSAVFILSLGLFHGLPVMADDSKPARELIYCADLMTHEEREAYRAGMRAARSPQEKAELRQAHRESMQARARERGLDTQACEPLRLRQRERERAGKP